VFENFLGCWNDIGKYLYFNGKSCESFDSCDEILHKIYNQKSMEFRRIYSRNQSSNFIYKMYNIIIIFFEHKILAGRDEMIPCDMLDRLKEKAVKSVFKQTVNIFFL